MYNGRTLNQGYDGKILINDQIKHPKLKELQVWYKQNKDTLSPIYLTESHTPKDGEVKRRRFKTLIEVIEQSEHDLRNKPSEVYFINAFLSYIKSDENTVYPSCLTCKKKVIKNSSNQFECTNCNQTVENPPLNYNLTTKLEDGTGQIYARFFGVQANQIMSPITPKQFQITQVQAKSGDDKNFKDMINNQLYKIQNLMIIAKTNNQSQRIDYSVQKISNFNKKETNRGILDTLRAYHQKETKMSD